METKNTNANAVETNEEDVYKLVTTKFAQFDSSGEYMITTTKDLAGTINSLFKPAFADYFGCNLVPAIMANSVPVVVPYLYFKVLPDEQYRDDEVYAFKSIRAAKKSSSMGVVETLTRMNAFNGNPMNNSVLITKEAKDVFTEFVPTSGNQKIEWDKNYHVKQMGDTFAYIKNVDIVPIIKKLYGAQDSEGKPAVYSVLPQNPITTGNQNMMNPYMASQQGGFPNNWIINILKLNEGALTRAAESAGMMMNNNQAMFPVVMA